MPFKNLLLKIAITEERLAPSSWVPDNEPNIAALRKPKIGGCDFWDPASEQLLD